MSNFSPELFKSYLVRFTDYFQSNPRDPAKAQVLREELDKINTDDVINSWIELLQVQGPIEKISSNLYEIYDVHNLTSGGDMTSSDYIHVVELIDNENTASVFMKFYFVFYCLNNGIKSNSYKITINKGNNHE